MAQPTLTSRPATWAGTSAPILYKFTSTNYANAGYYMAVEIWNATAAAKIAEAKYYANPTGSVIVDVSAFLKSSMSLDLKANLTSGTVYEDVNWVKYYIKYQEIWTASSESQVDDVANLRFAIYGGLQLGVINDFTDYVDPNFLFLCLNEYGSSILNQNFLIGFISNNTDEYMKIERYLNGSTLGSSNTSDFGFIGAAMARIKETSNADRIDVSVWGPSETEILSNGDFATDASDWVAAWDGWTLQGGDGCIAASTFPQTADQFFLPVYSTYYPAGNYRVIVKAFSLNISEVSNLSVGLFDNYSLVDEVLNFNVNWVQANMDANAQDTGVIAIAAPFNRIAITATYISGGVVSVFLSSASLLTEDDIKLSETKTINILPECQNTIVLSWRNSLGGWECHPFTHNQEYTWHYSDRKAKRLTLYADNLTLSQWEAIQGLNTLGDLYRSPITEMTTSINRTMATIGQSVYVLNSDGTKIGVNVIGQPNTTFTKRKKHSAFVTIEYPELFLQ